MHILYYISEIDQVEKLHYKPEHLPCTVVDKVSGNLRRRLNNSNKSSKEISTQTPKKSLRNNPLHWFGLFVSPSLRASQDHFKLGKKRYSTGELYIYIYVPIYLPIYKYT
jgi:hypothetical protein